jgi:hypothetical protein
MTSQYVSGFGKKENLSMWVQRISSFRFISGSTFILALLLFLLPFITVRCGKTKLAHYTGVQCLTQSGPTIHKGVESGLHSIIADEARPQSGTSNTQTSPGKQGLYAQEAKEFAESSGMYTFLLLAVLAGIVGAATSFLRKKWALYAAMLAGCMATLGMLITFMLLLKQANRMHLSAMLYLNVSVRITFWFYLSTGLFAGATWLARRQYYQCANEQEQAMIADMMAKYPIVQDTDIGAGPESAS